MIDENVPKLGKALNTEAREANKIPNYCKAKRPPLRFIIKTFKSQRILKAARIKKDCNLQRKPHQGFSSSEKLQARKKQNDIFKILKD